MSAARIRLLPAWSLALALALAGCLDDDPDTPAATLRGVVASGGSPAVAIVGANVTVYRAGPGGAVTATQAATDIAGNFTARVPLADDGSVYYVIARKGGTVELAALLGTTIPAQVTINEMTTVATAYAMAQFLAPDGGIGGPASSLQVAAAMAENLVASASGTAASVISASPNADQTNAWRSLGTLSNILAACVQNRGNACTSLFALTPFPGGSAPATTLQAILSVARNPAANVRPLFALGEILKTYEPSLTPLQGPDSSDADQKLDAFTLAVKVNATGGGPECQFGGPGNVAFDQRGYAWITVNTLQGTPNSSHCVVVLQPDGRPADGANGTPRSPIVAKGGIVGGGFGVAVDPSGNAWTSNFGWGNDVPTSGGVSEFNTLGAPLSPDPPAGFTSGTVRVQGIAADLHGNLWLGSFGNSALVVYPKGIAANYLSYTNSDSAEGFGTATADDGSGWATYTKTSNVAKFTLTSTGLQRQFQLPLGTDGNLKGVALDSQGNAWVAAGKVSTVYHVSPAGALLDAFTGRGFDGPWGLSVDARDNVWIANFGDDVNTGKRYSIVRLCGVTPSNCPPGFSTGDAISPPTGYTLPSAGSQVLLANGDPLYGPGQPPSYKPLMRMTSANNDVAGNVWVTNNWKPDSVKDIQGNPGGDGIVIFVGLGTPTKWPLNGQPKAP